jgi:hypothetical protein
MVIYFTGLCTVYYNFELQYRVLKKLQTKICAEFCIQKRHGILRNSSELRGIEVASA